MTDITVSVPEDLPEDERRRSVENQVDTKLSRHEEEARFNDHLRELYDNVKAGQFNLIERLSLL